MKLFPKFHQLELGIKNKSYLNSVFIGIVTPIMHLPVIIWQLLIVNTLLGIFVNFWMLMLKFLLPMIAGICGQVSSNDLTQEEAEKRVEEIAKNAVK